MQINNQCYRIANYFDNCLFEQQCASIDGVCRDFKCMCDTGNVFNGFQCVFDPDFQCRVISFCDGAKDWMWKIHQCLALVFCLLWCAPSEFPFSASILSGGLNCRSDEVPINNKCYPSLRRGQACYYTEQCNLEGGLECRDGICQDKIQSDQYPIPRGPGPVIFPPPPPQYPLPRPFPYPFSFPPPPRITIITICCLRTNNWPCCLQCCSSS